VGPRLWRLALELEHVSTIEMTQLQVSTPRPFARGLQLHPHHCTSAPVCHFAGCSTEESSSAHYAPLDLRTPLGGVVPLQVCSRLTSSSHGRLAVFGRSELFHQRTTLPSGSPGLPFGSPRTVHRRCCLACAMRTAKVTLVGCRQRYGSRSRYSQASETCRRILASAMLDQTSPHLTWHRYASHRITSPH
jgi:hypothetical protein